MRFLIIGGTGSLGKKLIDRLADIHDVFVYSRDESKQWSIKNDLLHSNTRPVQFYVGDIRDQKRLLSVIRQCEPHVIISAAALKQVDVCEINPDESIKTNLLGTQNIVDAVNEYGKDCTLLFVSTDKACAPVNTYGMCKALSERLVTSQARTGLSNIKYLCVRYGNVLESRGSIIPLFRYQAENSQYLTVTNPDMTRFLMTLDESVDLILRAVKDGQSGETWIPRLKAMRIGDIAEIFAEKYEKTIEFIEERPGEKMHEDLINASEATRTRETDDNKYYVISPAFVVGREKRFSYSSDGDVLTKEKLKDHLTKLEILDAPMERFSGKKIEEIVSTAPTKRGKK
jgi:UDP-N-acetylglucosamine 4,6-dehydratase/5-epimerase